MFLDLVGNGPEEAIILLGSIVFIIFDFYRAQKELGTGAISKFKNVWIYQQEIKATLWKAPVSTMTLWKKFFLGCFRCQN